MRRSSSRRSGSTCASSARRASSRTRRGCARSVATSPASGRLRGKSAPRSRSKKEAEVPKRELQGIVVTDNQAKTRVVRVERRFTHPVLEKTLRRSKKYYAHDENNEYAVGDVVWIEEHRPISKLKRWTVVRGEKKQKVT